MHSVLQASRKSKHLVLKCSIHFADEGRKENRPLRHGVAVPPLLAKERLITIPFTNYSSGLPSDYVVQSRTPPYLRIRGCLFFCGVRFLICNILVLCDLCCQNSKKDCANTVILCFVKRLTRFDVFDRMYTTMCFGEKH